MNCTTCGKSVSTEDICCPHCGTMVPRDIKKSNSAPINNYRPTVVRPTSGIKLPIKGIVISVLSIAVVGALILFVTSMIKPDSALNIVFKSAKPTHSEKEYEKTTEIATEGIAKSESESTASYFVDTQLNNFIEINSDLQYDVNIFLSNFSESSMKSFSCKANDTDMLDYAVSYNFINKNYEFEECDILLSNGMYGNYRIHKDKVMKTAEKYFGYRPAESSLSQMHNYQDGYFYMEITGGNHCNGFCVVSSLEDLGNNLYKAVFDVYFDGADGKIYYGCSPSEIEKHDVNPSLYLEKIRTGYAVIKADNIYDRSTYTLNSYYDTNA